MPAKTTETQTRTAERQVRATLADVKSLRGVHEELRLHAHLFKAELKDGFAALEQRWRDLDTAVASLEAARGAGREVLDAVRAMLEELRSQYARFKNVPRARK